MSAHSFEDCLYYLTLYAYVVLERGGKLRNTTNNSGNQTRANEKVIAITIWAFHPLNEWLFSSLH